MNNGLNRIDRLVLRRIVAIYALFGGLWIYFSDSLLGWMVTDPDWIVQLSAVKGFLFIIVTSLLLYHLMVRYFHKSRQDEEKLRAREEERRLLIEHLPAGVVVHAPDTAVLSSNAEARLLLGLSEAQLTGQRAIDPVWHLLCEDGTRMHAADFPVNQVLASGQVLKNFPMGIEREDGQSWVLVNAYPEQDRQGGLKQVVVLFTDITARKEAEEKIRRHLAHLSALVEISNAINASFDLNLVLTTLISHVIEQLRVDAAAVRLYNEATGMLEYVAGRGFYTAAIKQARPYGIRSAGSGAQTQTVVYLPDLARTDNAYLQGIMAAGEDFNCGIEVSLIVKGEIKGMLELFHRAAFLPDESWFDFLQTLSGQAAIAIDNTALFTHLERANAELAEAYNATIEGWSHALDLRDNQTEGHSQRVAELTMRLARLFGMSEADLVHIRWGALLHDIGKMGVPDHILRNVEALSDAEWEVIRQHPVHAHRMLAPIPYLQRALEIPYSHHEKWDGTGYPRGLKGEEIPLSARIFAVADVWDSLRSERYYRAAWPVSKVREHLRKLSGTHFDPHVVQVCLDSDVLTE